MYYINDNRQLHSRVTDDDDRYKLVLLHLLLFKTFLYQNVYSLKYTNKRNFINTNKL